jgi:hypothetical protein
MGAAIPNPDQRLFRNPRLSASIRGSLSIDFRPFASTLPIQTCGGAIRLRLGSKHPGPLEPDAGNSAEGSKVPATPGLPRVAFLFKL